MNKSKYTSFNYHNKNFYTTPNQKKILKKINNNNYKISRNNNNPFYDIGSTEDLVKIINNSKNNNSKEDRLIKSLESIDLFTKKIKEPKQKITKKQKTDIELLREIAFQKTNEIDFNKASVHFKNNSDLNQYNNEQFNEFIIKKNDDKIKIDGKEYDRNDYEHLSNIVMQKCNYGHKKYKKLDNIFYN